MLNQNHHPILVKDADPKWKDLYKIGTIFSVLISLSVLLAIVAFFIWPFKPGYTSTENIFLSLIENRFGGMVALDLSMLVITPMNIFMFLAIYGALKKINESYALIALILAMMAIILVIFSRPIVELVWLSDKYALSTTIEEKQHLLAAGETLHTFFNGTAWVIQTFMFLFAGLINCRMMLKTGYFSHKNAWFGIIISAIGLGFIVPVIGPIFLFLNTIGTVIWCLFLARDLYRMGWLAEAL